MSPNLDFELQVEQGFEKFCKCVVRLRTSTWCDNRGLHTKRSLTFLRRKCSGFNSLEDELAVMVAEDVLPRILNFDKCKDGIYRAIAVNQSRDWETGMIDDWDYELIPYE